MKLEQIPVDKIVDNPYEPRTKRDREAMDGLIDSVKEDGVKVPLTLRKKGENYFLVSGSRRLMAAKTAGLKFVPAVVKENMHDNDAIIDSIIENSLREDLGPIDRANALKSLLFLIPNVRNDLRRATFLISKLSNYEERGYVGKDKAKNGFTEDDIKSCQKYMNMMGIKRTAAGRYLSLLFLPEDIQSKVVNSLSERQCKKRGFIALNQAMEIARIPNPISQKMVYRKFIHSGMGLKGLSATVSEYIRTADDDLITPQRKAQIGADLSAGHLSHKCIDFAGTLTSWRTINMIKACSTMSKKDLHLHLKGLHASLVKLTEAVEARVFTLEELLAQKEEAKKKKMSLTFKSQCRLERHSDGRDGEGVRIRIPSAVKEAYAIKNGDILEVQVKGIIKDPDILDRKGNKFYLIKPIHKRLWANLDQTAWYYEGQWDSDEKCWIIPDDRHAAKFFDQAIKKIKVWY